MWKALVSRIKGRESCQIFISLSAVNMKIMKQTKKEIRLKDKAKVCLTDDASTGQAQSIVGTQ